MKRFLFTLTLVCLSMLSASCGQRPTVAVVGQLAPDFTLVDTKGTTWKLSDLEGEVVFINFWATWCSPCLKEMPSMQRVFTSMPKEKFKMLAILSNDEPAFADTVAAKNGYTFPILIDPDKVAAKAYGITGVPETYIIDKKGVLREKFLGPVQWDSQEAWQMLNKYINQ